ncbi:MAG: hypothetical protein L3K16_06465 [Thermoplasmata archaeon]|nr:hypothetical protein [Thermoplasmata archaeon]
MGRFGRLPTPARLATSSVVVVVVLVLVLVGGWGSGGPGSSAPASSAVAAPATVGAEPPRPGAGGVGAWANLTAGLPGSPGPRFASAGAWDAALNETVVFGGFSPITGPLRTTWGYSAGSWHSIGPVNLSGGNAPSSRYGSEAAYDPTLGALVVFGGRDSQGGLLNDTWSFSDGNWTNLSSRSPLAPPPRVNASMAFDPALGELLLFGGRSPNALYNDTWALNGTTWTSVGPPNANATSSPSARYGASLVYSAAASELVLFGGTGYAAGTYPLLGDTWTFGSSGWALADPGSSPSPRAFTAISVLPNGTPVLFGGLGAHGPLADTWEFTGPSWINETTSFGAAPPARSGAFASPVSVGNGTGYVLIFGGESATRVLDDTWAVGANELVVTAGAVTPSALDVFQTTSLTVVAFGPTTNISYAWSGLPAGCLSANVSTLPCTPTAVGSPTTVVSVTDDSDGKSVSRILSFVVNSPPTVSAVLVKPFPFVLGAGNVSITVHATGGTGILHYSYTGLPPGCLTKDTAFFGCAPTVLGSWTVNATATDATNESASQNATVVVVATGPTPPNRLVQALESPLGATAVIVGIGLVLMLVYALRRRSQTPPPNGSTRPTGPELAAASPRDESRPPAP